ncbi:MAG: hypothetical protein AVDCRST_MAG77-3210 [uncultured Chloroflexi bacterium]|uniref:Uncharacterized protein n=1 Tax=uncultured Chloroflexota bacterium TaxID=166587 RepID=A0A6J4J9T8_9CHLR|nr:MAG: hypothetical protein AVDCRST_MAG77-3210 [uncultured Chloroflexota bacterium]
METRQAAVGPVITALQAALGERQALLAVPDTFGAWRRTAALDVLIAGLLEQLAAIEPPAALLEDQAAALRAVDRLLNRGHAQRHAR